ncbi:MAG: hypothetical protein ACFB9N_04830 [Geitlerinemataceae cyanobacterium]
MSEDSPRPTTPTRMQLRPQYVVSFPLLLLTYAHLGWKLAGLLVGVRSWAIAGLVVLGLSELLASPWSIVRQGARWLNSDRRAFFSSMVATIAVVVLFIHTDVLANLLLLVAAGLLVRLDLQVANFSGWGAFAVLVSVASAGVGVGWLAHYFSLSSLLFSWLAT